MQRTLREEQEPAGEEVTEVAPGVLRMQLPISMPGLGHVNCYAIPDKTGYTIVDPGLPGPASWVRLGRRLDKADVKLADIHTVVVTHAHPDHFGNAGRLAYEAQADLVAHSAFRLWWTPNPADPCEQVSEVEIFDVDPEDLPQNNPWEGRTPWGGESFHHHDREEMRRRYGDVDDQMLSMMSPTPTKRVRDGEVLEFGRGEWLAIHTPGHTIDHLCMFHPETGVFLAGDHVLPTITPHISGMGARDPLGLFVDSLNKVAALDGVKLALPAHGHPFVDLEGRVEKIKIHHVERMEQLRDASKSMGPATVEVLMQHLFKPRSWGSMAESETYAHLEHMRLAGQAECHRNDDGKLIYEVVGAPV